MITNVKDIPYHIMGIYLLTYDNGKIYIGEALDIHVRANDHNRKRAKYPCDKALQVHNAEISILEEVYDIKLLEEKERYWIAKYNATNKKIGYNILKGGNISNQRGVDHANASLNQQQLDEVIDLLINHYELSLIDIAKRYGVTQNTILRISKGYHYVNPNLTYPLRNNVHDFAKKTYLEYFTSIEELIQCKEDMLYNWEMSLEEDIKNKYNLPLRIVHEINNGQKFADIGNFTYPIREKNKRNNLMYTKKEVLDILNDLRFTKKPMKTIGAEHGGVHRDTISKINSGKTYIIKDYDYPARKTKLNKKPVSTIP